MLALVTQEAGDAKTSADKAVFDALLLGPRADLLVGDRRKKLVDALRVLGRQEIDVRREALNGATGVMSNGIGPIADEASGLRAALLGVMKNAGWKLPAPSNRMFWLAGNGISVHTFPHASPATRKAAGALVKALNKVPLVATVGPDITADDVRIRMGAETFDDDIIILVVHPKELPITAISNASAKQ